MEASLYEIAQVVGAKNNIEVFDDFKVNNIEFDSRKIEFDDLFLPLQGERDGHDFITTAFKNGAGATFSEKELDNESPYILVDNCLEAFQILAKYYLEKIAVDVIAVTGSNGKTTTKDMIASILASKYKTYKTQGNYNNEIGLPYTALHMPSDTEKIVLEMGQDHMGDIHLLSEIAQPKISVVTLIGESHIEFFGSRENIAKGKMQIADGMPEGGTLIVPADKIINKFLPDNQKIVRFGADQDIHITNLFEHKDYLTFETNFLDYDLSVPLPGRFNATNAMLAACVGKLMGVDDASIKKSLSETSITKNRTEWLKAENGADILSDVYNANPTAMRLILETFQEIPKNEGGRKLVVLADMKELGENSSDFHAQMITAINPEKIDKLYLYGEEMEALVKYAQDMFPKGSLRFYRKDADIDELEALKKDVKEDLQASDQILLKGSNSMQLSKLVDELEARG